MDKKTTEALEKSIKHWEENVAAKSCYEMDVKSESCELCELFSGTNKDGNYCGDCPVFLETGFDCCDTTPYGRVYASIRDTDFPAAHEAAKAELEFLKGLRTC